MFFMTRYRIPREYKRTLYQEFSTFADAENLLRNYCNNCVRCNPDPKKCNINEALRAAMGENYPFWAKPFVKIELRDSSARLETKVVCKLFNPISKP